MPLKILFIGDVVGSPGRKIVGQVLPRLIPRWGLGLVVCNAENAAGGLGADDPLPRGPGRGRRRRLHPGRPRLSQGRGVHPLRADRPPAPPGQLPDRLARRGARAGRGQGRNPRRRLHAPRPDLHAAGRLTRSARPTALLERIGTTARVVVVDVHAEATSDKQLLGRYLDGRVSAVLGTHTHVATADEQILPRGTAYQTDVGMTGPHDSILGRRYDRVLAATLTFVPHHFDVATGDPRLHGALVEVDPQTGRALAIRRVAINQEEAQRLLTESRLSAWAPSRYFDITNAMGSYIQPSILSIQTHSCFVACENTVTGKWVSLASGPKKD